MLSDFQRVYKQIITGDKSWIYVYDQETTDQSSEYRFKSDAKPKRPRQKLDPSYSPNLAPCDFWMFPKLKRPLRGNRFKSIEEIERETVRALKTIPTDDFSACFEDWRKRWHKCIGVGGIILRGTI